LAESTLAGGGGGTAIGFNGNSFSASAVL